MANNRLTVLLTVKPIPSSVKEDKVIRKTQIYDKYFGHFNTNTNITLNNTKHCGSQGAPCKHNIQHNGVRT